MVCRGTARVWCGRDAVVRNALRRYGANLVASVERKSDMPLIRGNGGAAQTALRNEIPGCPGSGGGAEFHTHIVRWFGAAGRYSYL